MPFNSRQNRNLIWLTAAVLLLMYGLALTSMVKASPTFDEQGFITRGLGYLRGENQHMRVGHPLGLNALSALFLVNDDQVILPTDDPSWNRPNFHRPSELFLWEKGNDVEHVMFLSRVPTIWLGMLLAAVTGKWALEVTQKQWAGFMAMALIAFDPNILAHTRLSTTDLGLAFGATLAGFTLWRFVKRPSWVRAVIAGIGFGLLQNTKFTAALFVPLFALVIFIFLLLQWRANQLNGKIHFPWSPLVMLIVVYPATAFLTLWASYGFQVGTLPDNLPTYPQLGGLTLPLSHHLEQLLDIGGRLQKSTPSFLLGQYSDKGWWYYFPVAFLFKTPLPTLLLLAWVLILSFKPSISSRSKVATLDLMALLIPALGYFTIALTTEINLGYRHLLPVLPFLYVFVAVYQSGRFQARYTPVYFQPSFLLLIWLFLSTLIIHPHFLTYFNALAGGPDKGWRILVDSNIDWGQDLAALKGWMDDNNVEHVWLSYFGEARPDYYGLNYTGLNSYPPRLMNPLARPFSPHDPAPGIYAISASNLQGVLFANHDQFAWFRDKEPMVKIGYSIFIYQVPPRGEAVDLLLSGVQLDEIDPVDYALLGTNDVKLHWFDAGQSYLIIPGDNNWWVSEKNNGLQPELLPYSTLYSPLVENQDYILYHQKTKEIDFKFDSISQFSKDLGLIDFLGEISRMETAISGTEFQLVTAWKQQGDIQPVKIFIHAVNSDNTIMTQWDGLGAVWEGWRKGDILLQVHHLPLPANTSEGSYQLWAGLYHPDSEERWQTSDGDQLYLGELMVENLE